MAANNDSAMPPQINDHDSNGPGDTNEFNFDAGSQNFSNTQGSITLPPPVGGSVEMQQMPGAAEGPQFNNDANQLGQALQQNQAPPPQSTGQNIFVPKPNPPEVRFDQQPAVADDNQQPSFQNQQQQQQNLQGQQQQQLAQQQRAQQQAQQQSEQKKPEFDASHATMKYWKNIIVGFIIFTCITIVILLQVLMFIRNCTPTVNGILLSAGISITYFVFSLISLALLVGAYQAVEYGLKSVVFCLQIFTLIYGILLVILSICIFVIEMINIEEAVADKWKSMSQYQKDFFSGDPKKLEDERLLNTILCGVFTLVVGCCFIVIGGLSFKLHSVIGERMEFDKKAAERPYVPGPFLQQVQFKYQAVWWKDDEVARDPSIKKKVIEAARQEDDQYRIIIQDHIRQEKEKKKEKKVY